MVAPNNMHKHQRRTLFSLSPSSFSVNKQVVHQHAAEAEVVMTPLMLEMEVEMEPPKATMATTTATVTESRDMAVSATKQKKSVCFSEDVHVRPIPPLTQEEKNDMFYNKFDKRNAKLDIKRLVAFYRSGAKYSNNNNNSSNYFFGPPVRVSYAEDKIQQQTIAQDEQTKIGLEAHINPQFKLNIRRRMTKLVLEHQQWNSQHPNFFDSSFLGQNCTTVAKSATQMALDRAQSLVQELSRDRKQEAPITNITVTTTTTTTRNKKQEVQVQQQEEEEEHSTTDFSVRILCDHDDATTTTTVARLPAIEIAVVSSPSPGAVTTTTSSTAKTTTTTTTAVEAPSPTCMVR